MSKTKKFLSFLIAILFVITVFMTSAFADNEDDYEEYERFYHTNYDVFNSIKAWCNISGNVFAAGTEATCNSGHVAMVETELKWEDSVTYISYLVRNNSHTFTGTFATATAITNIDNPPSSYESDHFYYYDGIMRIEAYLPGPTIYIVN